MSQAFPARKGSVRKREKRKKERKGKGNLRNFGLVWGVWGVPLRRLKHISNENRRDVGIMVPHPNEIFENFVLTGN